MSRHLGLSTHIHAGIAALGNIKAKAECHTYEEYAAFLAGEKERVIASNVTVRRLYDDSIGVVLYETLVLRYYQDGTFSADNGGYRTLTTSNRCTQFGPAGVRFWHHRKQLRCNRGPTGHTVRYPVVVRPASRAVRPARTA